MQPSILSMTQKQFLHDRVGEALVVKNITSFSDGHVLDGPCIHVDAAAGREVQADPLVGHID